MTVRAVLLGLAGAATICGFTYTNDFILRQTFLVGNYMPISVYGGLLLFLLAVNPVVLLAARQRTPLGAGGVSGLLAGVTTALAGGLAALVARGPLAGVVTGLVAGVLVGAVAGLVAAYGEESTPGPFDGVLGALVGGLLGGAATGLLAGVTAGLFTGVVAAIAAGLAAGRRVLSGRELAVVVCLTLSACYVPGRGLMHYFSTFLMMPHHYARTDPGWKEQRVVEMAPRRMLAGVGPLLREEHVVDLPGLCSKLVEAGGGRAAGPARTVWELLGPETRATVGEVVKAAPEDKERRAVVIAALDAALATRDFHREGDYAAKELPAEARKLLERRQASASSAEPSLSPDEIRRLNRLLLDAGKVEGLAAGRAESAGLGGSDVLDWAAFSSRLVIDGGSGRAGPLGRLWQLLSPAARAAVEKLLAAEKESKERRAALVAALNELVGMPDLHGREGFAHLDLSREGKDLLARAGAPRKGEALSGEDMQRLNRQLLDSAFPQELVSLEAALDSSVNAFVLGLGEQTGRGGRLQRFASIPWHAWGRALLFWIPLLVAFSVAMIGLALVVHRQWSEHEQLPYPIVNFAHTLLPAEGEARGSVFRNRLFWIGAVFVLAIHMNNYAWYWWRDYLIHIPNFVDFRSLASKLPTFRRGGGEGLLRPTIYFTAVGFAYFLSTDVSLSLGIAPFCYALAAGIFAGYGISFWGGGFIAVNIEKSLFGGAYTGFFLVLLYTGRRYFLSVFRRCFGFSSSDEVEPHAVWGARVALVGAALFALQLVAVGLSLYLAVIYTLGAVIIFLVISRVVAETGVFFIHAYFFPCIMLWWFLGARAIGPEHMLIMFMVSSLLLIDPRESVLPYTVLGLKLVDMSKVRLGKAAVWGTVALLLGFAVATSVTLYIQHDRGATAVSDGWTRGVPRMAFSATVRAKQKLEAQGNLEEAGKLSGMAWIRSISPNVPAVVGFSVSMGLVLLFTVCRLRFPRWPLHPVLFLVLGTFQSRTLAASFLLGWVIKVLVLRFGGARSVDRLKPLMIGLIAGDMVGGVIPMIIGAVIYATTGEPPPGAFKVLPS